MAVRQEARSSFAEVNQTGNPGTNFLVVLEGDLKCQTRILVFFFFGISFLLFFLTGNNNNNNNNKLHFKSF